jgi:hypothetical protein
MVSLVLVVVLAVAGGAYAADPRLERAREEAGATRPPQSSYDLPAGVLRVDPPELVAANPGQRVRFTVALTRDAGDAALALRLPALWVRRADSGLPFADPPDDVASGSSGRAALDRSGRDVELAFRDGRAGDEASFTVEDVGIPAGTYELPIRWRSRDGSTVDAGTARVVFYAPAREGEEDVDAREGEEDANPWSRLPNPGAEVTAIGDAQDHPETAIVTAPGNPNRLAVAANNGSQVAVSDDGGVSYTRNAGTILSGTVHVRGGGTVALTPSGDPTLAADSAGNIWYSELSREVANGRILVARIPAGSTAFQPTVGLDRPAGSTGLQDKNLITIDNSPTSPTFGRLYLGWGATTTAAGGAVPMVISQCDTRPNPAACDNPDNWSVPVTVAEPSLGSNIFADPAVGPDGKVYFTWWDFSANNRVAGTTCDAGAANCAQATSWSPPQTIVTLDQTGGVPVPFACPILASPGGRVSPEPQVEVDHSDNPATRGRVYVTWGDLRAGSGSTRCSDNTPPAPTHLTWDRFVASAPNALPGASASSTSVGTSLYDDADSAGGNSDEFFTWLAVDQTSGQAYADFYSTRDDAQRRTVNFYMRSTYPTGAGHLIGPLTRLSGTASDHSDTAPCCMFDNDYGDYEGADATGNFAFGVWADRQLGTLDTVNVGTVLGVGASLTPTSLDLGSQAVGGQSGPQTVTLTNNGGTAITGVAPVVTGPVGLSGPAAGDFAISADGCSNRVLVPGESCSVQALLAPGSTGDKAATLTISSNAPAAQRSVALSGTGTGGGGGAGTGGGGIPSPPGGGPIPVVAVVPANFSFGKTSVRRDGTIVVRLDVNAAGSLTAKGTTRLAAARRRKPTVITYGSGRASAPGPGRVTVSIRARAKAKAALRKGRALRVKINATFTPTAGTPVTKTTTARVKLAKKRQR